MSKTNTIFFGVMTVMLMAISFFAGAITEQVSHIDSRNELLYERDSIQGYLDNVIYNADYNQMFNLKAKEVTEPCRKCSMNLSGVQAKLDSLRAYDGELVVPKAIRNPK